MHIKNIHHVAIICSDIERSKRFYVNFLGFTIKEEHYREDRDSYKVDLEINGIYQIELFSFKNAPNRLSYPEAKGLRHLAFTVSDIDTSIKKLQDKGINIEPVRLDPYTGKKCIFFPDPDGLPLELYED
jgi:Lactoylglutathione lyase and related lyases